MIKKITNPIRRVSFTMTRRADKLCFLFNGINRMKASKVLEKMKSFYGDCKMGIEKVRITNGKCYESVVASVSDPHTDILAEAEWPTIVTRFLQKDMPCEVTYFDNYEKFLNA